MANFINPWNDSASKTYTHVLTNTQLKLEHSHINDKCKVNNLCSPEFMTSNIGILT
jgi:hypothetical protein